MVMPQPQFTEQARVAVPEQPRQLVDIGVTPELPRPEVKCLPPSVLVVREHPAQQRQQRLARAVVIVRAL